jgi:hypothetical protein
VAGASIGGMTTTTAARRAPGRPRREGPAVLEPFLVRFDSALLAELRTLAHSNERHASAEIRHAVREHIKRERAST